MSISAVTPFRSYVQKPIFSVYPSSFRVSSRYSREIGCLLETKGSSCRESRPNALADIVVNIIMTLPHHHHYFQPCAPHLLHACAPTFHIPVTLSQT